jgi:hypothetical protein
MTCRSAAFATINPCHLLHFGADVLEKQLLRGNVEWFRGGLVLKAHTSLSLKSRLESLDHSNLGSRLIKKKKYCNLGSRVITKKKNCKLTV